MKKPKYQIGVGGTFIGASARRYVNDVLTSNRLSYGKYTQRLEEKFARLHNRKFAIFCNSGTSALQVAVHALKEYYGWKSGDEVLVPAITFIATSNVILQNNLKPVFVDVDKDYYEIDPKKIVNVIDTEFLGKIEQLPPIRSAVKRQLRTREIYYLEIL